MIRAVGLTKCYRERRVLDGICLQIGAGRVYALLGPNGAGKTTTVRILATLTAPDGGSALVAGHDVVTERAAVRRRISLTGQQVALDQAQTGRENLEILAQLQRSRAGQARRRATELLDRFELAEAADQRVATYSGGMRRRLDIAAGLIRRPSVLFLDEPTTGLDPRSRAGVWDLVAELAQDGVTVLLTTQYLEEADRLADHIGVIDRGRLVAEGTAAELKARVSQRRLDVRVATKNDYDGLAQHPHAVHHDVGALTVGFGTDGTAPDVRAQLDALDPQRNRIISFSLPVASLDDVFFALTDKKPAGA